MALNNPSDPELSADLNCDNETDTAVQNLLDSSIFTPRVDRVKSKSLPRRLIDQNTSTPCKTAESPFSQAQIGDNHISNITPIATGVIRKRAPTPDTDEKLDLASHSKKGKPDIELENTMSELNQLQSQPGAIGGGTHDRVDPEAPVTVGMLQTLFAEQLRNQERHYADLCGKMSDLSTNLKAHVKVAVEEALGERLPIMEAKIEKRLDHVIKSVDTQITGVKKTVQAQKVEMNTAVDAQLTSIRLKLDNIEENRKIEDRLKPNVIAFDLKESDAAEHTMRQSDDRKIVEEILNVAGNRRKYILKTHFRLGEKMVGRPRLLKIVLANQDQRDHLLHDNTPEHKFKLSVDRSKQERDRYKALKEELKIRSDNGEIDLAIRNDKIVKRPFRRPPPPQGGANQ
jgi:hypothetical protein